jgi:hypothetical protein
MNNSVSTVSVQVILLPNKPIPNQFVTVPAYNVVGTRTPLSSLRPQTTPTDVTHVAEAHHDESHVLAYSFVTIGVLAFVAVVMFVV